MNFDESHLNFYNARLETIDSVGARKLADPSVRFVQGHC
jgi:hypothetical protein